MIGMLLPKVAVGCWVWVDSFDRNAVAEGRSWLLGVGRQLSSAISHCHSRGVVHLDIKVRLFYES
jgi:hypothetical protein